MCAILIHFFPYYFLFKFGDNQLNVDWEREQHLGDKEEDFIRQQVEKQKRPRAGCLNLYLALR